MAKVLAFINYKGGVAKTTSACHIGCWLAGLKGKRVLLIDIDPQTNLTFLCASVEDWQKRKNNPGTILHMYKRYADGKPMDAKRYIWREPIRLRDGRKHPRVHVPRARPVRSAEPERSAEAQAYECRRPGGGEEDAR